MKESRERMTQQGYKEYRPTGLGHVNTAWPASIIPAVAGLNAEICVEVGTTKDMVYESYSGRVEKHYPYRFKLTVKGRHDDGDGYTKSSPECWIKSFGEEEPFYEICIPYHVVHSVEILGAEEQKQQQEPPITMDPCKPTHELPDYKSGIQKDGDKLRVYGFVLAMPDRIILEYGDDPDMAGRRIIITGDEIEVVDSKIVGKVEPGNVVVEIRDEGEEVTSDEG